jgi:hypothetical protein
VAEHLSPTQRLVVVSGHPTDIEVAAVTAALARHTARSAPDGHPSAGVTAPPLATSRWIRAARLEGCGHAPIDDPTGFTR